MKAKDMKSWIEGEALQLFRIICHWNGLLWAAVESLQLGEIRLGRHLPGVPKVLMPMPGSSKVSSGTT